MRGVLMLLRAAPKSPRKVYFFLHNEVWFKSEARTSLKLPDGFRGFSGLGLLVPSLWTT